MAVRVEVYSAQETRFPLRYCSRSEARKLIEAGARVIRSKSGKEVIQLADLERERRPSPSTISVGECLVNAGLLGSSARQEFIRAKVEDYRFVH